MVEDVKKFTSFFFVIKPSQFVSGENKPAYDKIETYKSSIKGKGVI